ncbi:methyltransferase family protein [Chloroflexota bacterium]
MNGLFETFHLSILLIFTSLFVSRIIYMRRVKITSTITFNLKSGEPRNFLTFALVVTICVWVPVMLVNVLHPEIRLLPAVLETQLTETSAAKITGMSIIILGLVIYIPALLTLGDYWRVGDTKRREGRLVTHGIYAISRNPIYVFFVLYFLGTFLINGLLIFLIFTIMGALNVHYLVIEEEKLLMSRYGAAFRDYRATTGRYATLRINKFRAFRKNGHA